jgi:predicted Zn-dependent protease
MGAQKTRLLLIIGALLLFVLLFIAPKIAPKSSGTAETAGHEKGGRPDATLDVYLNQALKNAEPGQKRELDRLSASRNYDSLVTFWNKAKRPDLAAYYVEELAKDTGTAGNWIKAGNRYYYSVQFSKDKTELPVLYQCAIRCFKKGLELDPQNNDAKIMLASCYVEGTNEPMEGISKLKEVERTDSNNVKLQLAFAFFSVKSGQTDKAVERFKKVLRIDSNYIEAYLHLADAYEQQGNTTKTIECLEKYSSRTGDITAKLEINKYITQLKEK